MSVIIVIQSPFLSASGEAKKDFFFFDPSAFRDGGAGWLRYDSNNTNVYNTFSYEFISVAVLNTAPTNARIAWVGKSGAGAVAEFPYTMTRYDAQSMEAIFPGIQLANIKRIQPNLPSRMLLLKEPHNFLLYTVNAPSYAEAGAAIWSAPPAPGYVSPKRFSVYPGENDDDYISFDDIKDSGIFAEDEKVVFESIRNKFPEWVSSRIYKDALERLDIDKTQLQYRAAEAAAAGNVRTATTINYTQAMYNLIYLKLKDFFEGRFGKRGGARSSRSRVGRRQRKFKSKTRRLRK